MYRKILVSVTNPGMAEAVAELAGAIVDLEGRITVLNVIEVPYHLPYMYADEKLDEANAVVDDVRDIVDKGTAPTVKVKGMVVVARSPAEVILHQAKAEKHDLILMGASVRSKTTKMLFGDVVDVVLKNAPCDVMVLSHLGWTEHRYDRVLLTTTGYKHSKKAIQIAESLAKWHEETKVATLSVAKSLRERKKDESIVNGIKKIFTRDGIPAWGKVLVSSRVADAIVEEARKGKYRLILLGATEKPPAYKFILGSIVDEVIRRAPCPVIVIKTVEH